MKYTTYQVLMDNASCVGYKMAQLPEVRAYASEQAGSSRRPIDVGTRVASPNEVQVSLLFPGGSSPTSARLSLTARNIVLELEVPMNRAGSVELLLLDLLGALIRPQDDGSCSLQLHMFAYSKMTKRGLIPTTTRRHEIFTVFFPHRGEDPTDSRTTAEQWKASLLQRCCQRCRDIFVYEPAHQRQGEFASCAVTKHLAHKETAGGLHAGTADSYSAVVHRWPGPALVLAGAVSQLVHGVWNIPYVCMLCQHVHALQTCACWTHKPLAMCSVLALCESPFVCSRG